MKASKNFCRVIGLLGAIMLCLSPKGICGPVADLPNYIHTIRFTWEPHPGAVSYQVAIMKENENIAENIIAVKKRIFATGYELDTSVMRSGRNYYWKVCPLDYDGNIMAPYSQLRPLAQEEINPLSPLPVTEFNEMEAMPVYPVFSWIPMQGAREYDIRVYQEQKKGGYKLIRELASEGETFYEYAGYTTPGKYYWQVRARGLKERGEWSEKSYFTVEKRHPVAALGDSITHGGGVISLPPCYRLYNWETYCSVPVKNIGYSGDTVQVMAERFQRDVLPFSPRVLLIMGGVNNFREGDSVWATINGLREIRELCYEHNIIPVFITATPINPHWMKRLSTITPPVEDWKARQEAINRWIEGQEHHIDVASDLTDEYGLLRDEMTTDGLHPDLLGKELIGKKVDAYLRQHFSPQELGLK